MPRPRKIPVLYFAVRVPKDVRRELDEIKTARAVPLIHVVRDAIEFGLRNVPASVGLETDPTTVEYLKLEMPLKVWNRIKSHVPGLTDRKPGHASPWIAGVLSEYVAREKSPVG